MVKETQRKLCVLALAETDTLRKVKEEILRKNQKVVVKNLVISKEQCITRIIKLFIGDNEWQGDDAATLKSLEWMNGNQYTLIVRFVRALAFLSEQEISDMVSEVERRTQGKYPQEMIL